MVEAEGTTMTQVMPVTAPLELDATRGPVEQSEAWPSAPEPVQPLEAEAVHAGTMDAEADDAAPQEISDVDVMLGMLAAEHRQSERTSDLAAQLNDKGTRTMVMIGGAAVIGMVLFVLMAIAGLFT